MGIFIDKDVLDALSYTSTLNRSLKQISLRETPIEMILEDIARYRSTYIDIVVQENLIGSRFKSDDSIIRKYEKTIGNGGGFKQCFNDILGFRLHLADYPTEFPDYFRIVDLRKGKKMDDGYHAVHLYYQRDNRAYPIEIQLWCGNDYQYNVWSHRWLYKYRNSEVGRKMYQLYTDGYIQSENEFISAMKEIG